MYCGVLNGEVNFSASALAPFPTMTPHVDYLLPIRDVNLLAIMMETKRAPFFDHVVSAFTHDLWAIVMVYITLYCFLFALATHLNVKQTVKASPESSPENAVESLSQNFTLHVPNVESNQFSSAFFKNHPTTLKKNQKCICPTHEGKKKEFFPRVFQDTAWTSLGMLLRQRGGDVPAFPGSRIMSFSWWIFCLITITVYTANLTANLSRNEYTVPIDSIEELLTQSKVKYGIHLSMLRLFERSQAYAGPNVDAANIAKFKENLISKFGNETIFGWDDVGIEVNQTTKEAVSRFLFEGSAIIVDDYTANGIINSYCRHRLKILKGSLSNLPVGLAVPKGSPLKDVLSEKLFEYQLSGRLAKWKKNEVTCEQEEEEESGKQVNLGNLKVMFFAIGSIFCIGFIYSIICGLLNRKNRLTTNL